MDGDERLPPLEDLPAGAYSGGYELEGRMARPGENDTYSDAKEQILPQEDMLDRMDQIRQLERLEQVDQGGRRGHFWHRSRYAQLNQTGMPGQKFPQYPDATQSRADRYVIFAFWVIEISLIIRVILRLMAGDPHAAFTSLVYGLTWPFVIPFAGVFPSPTGGGHELDAPAILALFIYPLVAWGIVRLIELHHYRNRRTT